MRLTEANRKTQMFCRPEQTGKRWSQKQMPVVASPNNLVCGSVGTGAIYQCLCLLMNCASENYALG